MSGIESLAELLAGLEPELVREQYVFATLAPGDAADRLGAVAFAVVRERESDTVVLEEGVAASAGLQGAGPFRRITLGVHSSLQAVGLTAAVTQALAGAGIGANMIAGYYHDHVFVPADRALEALALLRGMQAGSGR